MLRLTAAHNNPPTVPTKREKQKEKESTKNATRGIEKERLNRPLQFLSVATTVLRPSDAVGCLYRDVTPSAPRDVTNAADQSL